MGLDITAYRRLRPVACVVRDDPDEWCEHVRPHRFEFPEQADSLEDRCYEAEGQMGFRAGSYSGYNHWRATLSQVALGVPPEVVWADPLRFRGQPFVELINFSDCEGTIGPSTSAKLAQDFARFEEEARAQMDEYGYAKYREWRQAFEMAADEGAVDFH